MSTSDPRRSKVSKTSPIDLDRLSSLPNPVKFRILSFLPTKDAARTSLLSTMWKRLFLHVPKIILDDVLVREKLKFIEFVNRWLLLSNSSITEFVLKGEKLYEVASSINLWLSALLSRNLQVLEIEQKRPSISNPAPLCPPRDLFASATLVVLKICGWNILLKIPQSVYLPKLKVLHLKSLCIPCHSDRFMFSEGYPVLEDLRLEYVRFSYRSKKVSVGIVLRSLQKLTIAHPGDQFTIDIDTPHLQHFLNTCSYVAIRAPHMGLHWHPNSFFPKLTNLELNLADGGTMWIFLERAPILKSLVYDMRRLTEDSLPVDVPVCFSDNLRQIKLKGFMGGDAECAAVRYLLQHAAMLEEMTLELDGCGIQELPSSALKLLIEQPRRSLTCRIEILERCS